MNKNDKIDRAIHYLKVYGKDQKVVLESIKDLESLKTKTKAKKPSLEYSSDVKNCFNSCLKFFPYYLYPKSPDTWYEVIDKLNRVDDVEFKEIERVVAAVRANEFWSKNFQSMAKLRTLNREAVQYFVSYKDKFPLTVKKQHSNFAQDSAFD